MSGTPAAYAAAAHVCLRDASAGHAAVDDVHRAELTAALNEGAAEWNEQPRGEDSAAHDRRDRAVPSGGPAPDWDRLVNRLLNSADRASVVLPHSATTDLLLLRVSWRTSLRLALRHDTPGAAVPSSLLGLAARSQCESGKWLTALQLLRLCELNGEVPLPARFYAMAAVAVAPLDSDVRAAVVWATALRALRGVTLRGSGGVALSEPVVSALADVGLWDAALAAIAAMDLDRTPSIRLLVPSQALLVDGLSAAVIGNDHSAASRLQKLMRTCFPTTTAPQRTVERLFRTAASRVDNRHRAVIETVVAVARQHLAQRSLGLRACIHVAGMLENVSRMGWRPTDLWQMACACASTLESAAVDPPAAVMSNLENCARRSSAPAAVMTSVFRCTTPRWLAALATTQPSIDAALRECAVAGAWTAACCIAQHAARSGAPLSARGAGTLRNILVEHRAIGLWELAMSCFVTDSGVPRTSRDFLRFVDFLRASPAPRHFVEQLVQRPTPQHCDAADACYW